MTIMTFRINVGSGVIIWSLTLFEHSTPRPVIESKTCALSNIISKCVFLAFEGNTVSQLRPKQPSWTTDSTNTLCSSSVLSTTLGQADPELICGCSVLCFALCWRKILRFTLQLSFLIAPLLSFIRVIVLHWWHGCRKVKTLGGRAVWQDMVRYGWRVLWNINQQHKTNWGGILLSAGSFHKRNQQWFRQATL